MRIERTHLDDARRVLAGHFGETPLVPAASLGRDVRLKLETELPTGSFKVRGAVYALTVNVQRAAIREVIAASTGNHGAAVAYAGQMMNIPVIIFLPARPNPVKASRIRALGARIDEGGADLSEAIDRAYEYAARHGAFFLHDATDPDVPAGTGTIAMEIVEQLPAVETLYVPMGDTALIRGVASAAKHLKPGIRVIGAVAERAPAYFLAWQQNAPVETPTADTMADGLAVRRALAENVADIRALVDEVRLIREDELLSAIARLMTGEQVIAEPAGAAATAALLQDQERSGPCAVLVTGRNIAPEIEEAVRAARSQT